MMQFSDYILGLISMVATAGAIYGAIRSDLKNMMDHIALLREDLKDAHDRIDSLLKRP
jgi:hypothetical protein